jgi:uncharacterized coiled-coil protein SlyX
MSQESPTEEISRNTDLDEIIVEVDYDDSDALIQMAIARLAAKRAQIEPLNAEIAEVQKVCSQLDREIEEMKQQLTELPALEKKTDPLGFQQRKAEFIAGKATEFPAYAVAYLVENQDRLRGKLVQKREVSFSELFEEIISNEIYPDISRKIKISPEDNYWEARSHLQGFMYELGEMIKIQEVDPRYSTHGDGWRDRTGGIHTERNNIFGDLLCGHLSWSGRTITLNDYVQGMKVRLYRCFLIPCGSKKVEKLFERVATHITRSYAFAIVDRPINLDDQADRDTFLQELLELFITASSYDDKDVPSPAGEEISKEIATKQKKLDRTRKKLKRLQSRSSALLPENESIALPSLVEFERLQEQLKVFLIRGEIQKRCAGVVGSELGPEKEFKKYFVRDILGNGFLKAALEEYDKAPGVKLWPWGSSTKVEIQERYNAEVVDEAVVDFYKLFGYIYKLWQVKKIYIKHGNPEQKQWAAILQEIVIIYSEKLQEMATNLEAKLAVGEFCVEDMQAHSRNLLGLLNSRRLFGWIRDAATVHEDIQNLEEGVEEVRALLEPAGAT